jgi:hypothetical protein
MIETKGFPMYMSSTGVKLLTALILCIVLGCNKNAPTVMPAPLPEGNCVGKVRNADGTPVQGASVLLVPQGYAPITIAGLPKAMENITATIDSTLTDASGGFGFSIPKNGTYNLLMNGNGQYAMRKSVAISANARLELPDEIALEPGSISGIVHVESMNASRSAIVLIMGTNRYVTPSDSEGHFTLSALAQGDYLVRFICMKSGFTSVDTTISVEAKKETDCPPVVLQKKYQPRIDSFAVSYDPLMMTANLRWKIGDNAPIDSIAVYCNREKNLTPVFKTSSAVSSVTLDIIASPIDTFVYQIAAIGKDGLEGEPVVAQPFVKYSAITMTQRTLSPDFASYGRDMFGVTHGIMYSIGRTVGQNGDREGSTIKKISGDYAIEKTIYYPKPPNLDDIFEGKRLRFDGNGNFYAMFSVFDTAFYYSIDEFDKDLNVVNQFPIGREMDEFSFAVSSNGSILLYAALNVIADSNGNVLRGSLDSTEVRVYDSEKRLISEYGLPGKLMIKNALIKDQTVTAEIFRKAWTRTGAYFGDDSVALTWFDDGWELKEAVRFDANFNIIGKIDRNFAEIEKRKPAVYDRLDLHFQLCTDNLFMGGYSTKDISLPQYIFYFCNEKSQVVARMPTSDFILGPVGLYIDHATGNFYQWCNSSCKHNNILLMYTLDNSLTER